MSWALVLVMTPVFLVLAVMRNQRKQSVLRSATVELDVDGEGIRRRLADGRTEEISWTEVTEVDVFTARVGPHKPAGGAAVFYGDDERGCIVPLDRIADSGLFDHLHRLPAFDLNAFIQAITASDRRERETAMNPTTLLTPKPLQVTTVIWTREPPPGAPGPEAGPDVEPDAGDES